MLKSQFLQKFYKFIDELKEKIYSKSVNSKPTKVIDNNSTSKSIILSEDEIQRSQNYFYKLATMEVKKFANLSQYDKLSFQKEDILYYTGRILYTQEVKSVSNPTAVMSDLCTNSFCVPIIYRNYSPPYMFCTYSSQAKKILRQGKTSFF